LGKGRAVKDLSLVVLGASAVAWIALLAATMSEAGSRLYNSSMVPGSTVGSTLAFLGAWEIMVIAMMLPSSLGFFTLFRTVTGGSRFPIVCRTAVCVGYALVWAGVGALAIIVSGALYRMENFEVWLEGHPNLLAASVLALAGCFQFTALKRRCLAICSHPGSFLMRHYRRGVGNAFALGARYGLICLGCCWALMTLMVVVGGGDLYLMIALTAIMFAERMMGWDDRFVAVVGFTCIALGVLIVVSPSMMPALAQNAETWLSMESMRLPHYLGAWCHA
jgi:predicted metal-binding membrane protein